MQAGTKARSSGRIRKKKMISKKFRSRNQAQAALEYAMVVICLVGALFAMRIYMKRSIQGRLREAADSLGEQYAPRHITDSVITTTQTGTTNVKAEEAQREDEEVGTIFGLETTTTTDETTNRIGHENLDKFEKNLFD